jgi:hypothetical protein
VGAFSQGETMSVQQADLFKAAVQGVEDQDEDQGCERVALADT